MVHTTFVFGKPIDDSLLLHGFRHLLDVTPDFKADCLRVDGRNLREIGVTGCRVIHNGQIHFSAFREKDCLLVDFTSADNKYAFNLLLHRLTLCEDDGFVDRATHINRFRKLQLSILQGP